MASSAADAEEGPAASSVAEWRMGSSSGDYLVDFAVLEEGLRGLVQQLLERQGSFLPCGGIIDRDGRFSVAAVLGGEQPDPRRSVHDHLEAFRKAAAMGSRAWGVAADVTLEAPGQRPRDGVRIWLEHRGGRTSELVLSYERTETSYHLGEARPAPGSIPGGPRHPRKPRAEAPLLPVVDYLLLSDPPGPVEPNSVRAGIAVIDPSPVPGFDAAMAQAVHRLRSLRVALTTSWELGGLPPRLVLNLQLRPLRRPWRRLAARIVFDVDACRDWLTLALAHRIALVTPESDGRAWPNTTSAMRRAVDVTPSEQEKRLLVEALSVQPPRGSAGPA
jgi:hypothetical protein